MLSNFYASGLWFFRFLWFFWAFLYNNAGGKVVVPVLSLLAFRLVLLKSVYFRVCATGACEAF